ncbi:hypothetical protein ACIGXM_13480 [Kitasatospora sp. NPDC052896]|uniref:hypothetical protein n=1 Tax=Kitasatospora sp. NPDC052896 TaxID=3364061 RepID=UPI0037CCA5B9
MARRTDGPVPAAHGRHGRPKPFGGHFRLPAIKVSGAAMAMSTVVGISIATTWLVSAQQRIGIGTRMSTVGATPPMPTPTPLAASSPTARPLTVTPMPDAGGLVGPAAVAAPADRARPDRAPAGPAPSSPAPTAQASGPSAPASTATPTPAASTGPTSSAEQPAASAPTASTPTSAAQTPPQPRPSVTPGVLPGTPGGPPVQNAPSSPGDTSDDAPDSALSGTGSSSSPLAAGRLRTLTLTVGEPLAAVEVELRLDRVDAAGAMAWSSLPDAGVTVHQDGPAVVYRFAPAPGEDVAPGRYTFTVQAAADLTGASARCRGTWSASGFALRHPRAVATHGAFRRHRAVPLPSLLG